MSKKPDAEMTALRRIDNALEGLDAEAQTRILRFVASKVDSVRVKAERERYASQPTDAQGRVYEQCKKPEIAEARPPA